MTTPQEPRKSAEVIELRPARLSPHERDVLAELDAVDRALDRLSEKTHALTNDYRNLGRLMAHKDAQYQKLRKIFGKRAQKSPLAAKAPKKEATPKAGA